MAIIKYLSNGFQKGGSIIAANIYKKNTPEE